jgi:hypothetical protein
MLVIVSYKSIAPITNSVHNETGERSDPPSPAKRPIHILAARCVAAKDGIFENMLQEHVSVNEIKAT